MMDVKDEVNQVKKFHDFWAFLSLITLYLSFYSYLVFFRFVRTSDVEIGKHLHMDMYVYLFLFTLMSIVAIYISILFIEYTLKITYYIFIPIAILFLIFNSSLYEKICCSLAISKFLYFLYKYKEFKFSNSILSRVLDILNANIIPCIFFCIFSSALLLLHITLYIGLTFKNEMEMYILNLIFFISLYCMSSLIVYATKVFIYNLFMHSCIKNINTSIVSLRNTIYSLGSISLSFCALKSEDIIRISYIIYYIVKYVISCLSYTYEIVIHITTSYLLYIIGIHNYKLKAARREKHKLDIKESLKKQIEYFNDYLVILGCLYMLGINKIYIFYTKTQNLKVYDPYCLLYTYNISFIFSIFMLLISSSFISSIFLYTDNPSLLLNHNESLFNCLESCND